ncbi:MAG: bifunctional diguanylate cyclase/phosphodiesterase [Acidobacteriota bacterium]|nr:bifunctional diguanylate cyclase/phosphodiesterase [Acidobacteriota bacterium]
MLSFSDSIVFLTFLVYGGEMAILIAFVEAFANGLYLKNQKLMSGYGIVIFNSSLASFLTAFTYAIVLSLTSIIGSDLSNTRTLITVLGVLCLSQFFSLSVFIAVYQNIKAGNNIWEVWKTQCLSISFTQFAGAGLAGIVYKLISYADFAMTVIAALILGIAYINYRKMISDVNESIEQAEAAERAKAEIERTRRREAEKHVDQLGISLKKEERANAALRKSEKDFQHAALHDALTGLANRKQFGNVLRAAIENYKEDPTANFQILFLDIRSFKNINDALGHTIGDKVLVIAAKRFVRMLNPTDTVARIGGDEFAIILNDLSTVGKAQKVARRIYESLTQPFSLGGNNITIDLNIGIAPCDVEYETPEEILRDADIAMHYAKEKNEGPAVFTKELRERFLERVRLEMDLRQAIERGELSMHYQPIISLSDGRLEGFEALLRWHHSEFGMIPPNKFIPIAEVSGLIIPITVWILEQTTGQIKSWQQISPEYAGLMVSVNISGVHLSNDDLIDHVEYALEKSKLLPDRLKLEITESSAMKNAQHTINVLQKLKKIGVQLSMDDFGTGYSSLSYLQRLPFDTLKIDRSFVCGVGERGENSEILQTIISLAKNLKMRVIAEGIETPAQLAVLQNLGCDFGQGFLMAKPKASEETENLLYQRPNWLPGQIDLENISQKESVANESLRMF